MAVAQSETATIEPDSKRPAPTDKLYEGMFLVDSGKFASNPDKVTQHLLEILEKAGASVVAHRPWLDGRLAYEIEGKRKGLHYLIYFRMAGRGIPQITRSCKLSEIVMRHMVIRQPQTLFDAMVAAIKPEEETRAVADDAADGEDDTGDDNTGDDDSGDDGDNDDTNDDD